MGSQFAAGDYTILIVDSDRRVSAELAALLVRAGYHTRLYRSAEELLQAIADYPADYPENVCVVSEVELPGMSGLELIARMRAAHIDTPVVILTRLSDVATAVRAMRDSVSDYLMKPYVERDLINRLRTALTRPHATPH